MYVTMPVENLEDISLVFCPVSGTAHPQVPFSFLLLFEGAETPRDMLLKDIHCDDKNVSSCALSASDA